MLGHPLSGRIGRNESRKLNAVIVVPTYNEVRNLGALVARLFSEPLPNLRIIIVDDESPDGTGRLADDLAAGHPGRIDVLHRRGRRGLGLAYRDGFRWAIDLGTDAIVQMDADMSHSPADVPRLLAALDDCDVAVGSRYVPGGTVDDHWGAGRQALSWSANVYARALLRLKTRDATAGFKCWRRTALEAVDIDRMASDGYIIEVEMAYVSERLGLKIREVPIYFADRREGLSKMTTRSKIDGALGVFRIWRRHHRIQPLGSGRGSSPGAGGRKG